MESKRWPERCIAVLTQMWRDGFSASQIAGVLENFRYTRNAVIGKAHRLGLVNAPRQQRPQQKRKRASPGRRIIMAPVPKFTPLPVKIPEPSPESACTLFELGEHRCRYPLGDDMKPPPYMFCGGPTIAGSSYCAHHTRVCCPGTFRHTQPQQYQSLRPRY